MQHLHIPGRGIKSRLFTSCLGNRAAGKNTSNSVSACANELQESCKTSRVRIIKTIRIALKHAKQLLETIPEMKIIHLVRDPRATLLSQSRLGRCSLSGGRPACVNNLCRRLENDVLEEEKMLRDYPHRVLPILYEDIANRPIEMSKAMYNFIGYDFTKTVEEFVMNITSSGKEKPGPYSTRRGNSSEHIDTWKSDMDSDFIKLVQERCNYIIRRYNYDFV